MPFALALDFRVAVCAVLGHWSRPAAIGVDATTSRASQSQEKEQMNEWATVTYTTRTRLLPRSQTCIAIRPRRRRVRTQLASMIRGRVRHQYQWRLSAVDEAQAIDGA
ncbi:hypothetical protein B0H10DRAFT_1315706 [Mycena sp. CBHHK59/15]|nr:hypothetical protein B0H10DRAFT_1315706 [Mycena sp. CBHHK59/15]